MNEQGVDATLRLAALFNNSSFAAVLVAANDLISSATDGLVTTRRVASATGIADSVVRPVMTRLVRAGFLHALPKVGAGNTPQFYARSNAEDWELLLQLVGRISGAPKGLTYGPQKDT